MGTPPSLRRPLAKAKPLAASADPFEKDLSAALSCKCADKSLFDGEPSFLSKERSIEQSQGSLDELWDALDLAAEDSEGEWYALDELFSSPEKRRLQSISAERFANWAGQNCFSLEDVLMMVQEASEGSSGRVQLKKLREIRRQGVNMFSRALQQKRGAVLRAWRLDLDLRGTGRISHQDVERVCLNLGLDLQRVRCALRLHGPWPPSLRHLEPSEASNFRLFVQAIGEPEDLDLDGIWERMDVDGSGTTCLEHFVRVACEEGFKGDAELLFHGLDTSGQGRLLRGDFDYIRALSTAMLEPTPPTPPLPRLLPDMRGEAVEDTAAHFVRWMLPRWPLLQRLFCTEGKRPRTVPVLAFARWVQQLHFDGDPFAVAQCLQDEESREVSLPQIQRLRQQHSQAAAQWFLGALRKRRGAVLRAFRLDLDSEGRGRVSRADFDRACCVFGCGDDVDAIWDILHSGRARACLEFGELDGAEAQNLHRFAQPLLMDAGFDLEKAWSRIDIKSAGVVQYSRLAAVARELSCQTCDTGLLADGLDVSGQGFLGREELEYAWLLVLRAMRQWARGAPSDACSSQAWEKLSDLLLERLGLGKAEPGRLPCNRAVVRLTALGFSGDTYRAAAEVVQLLLQPGTPEPAQRPVWDDSPPAQIRKPNPKAGSRPRQRTLEESHGTRTALVGSNFRPFGTVPARPVDAHLGRAPRRPGWGRTPTVMADCIVHSHLVEMPRSRGSRLSRPSSSPALSVSS